MPWDSPLAAVAELVSACGDLGAAKAGELRVSEVVVATPLEMSVWTREDGTVELAAAPPRQARETSVMPVLHRIRLRVEVE